MADYTAQCSSNQYITLLLRTQVVSQDVGGNTTTLNWSLHVLKSGASTSATWGNCSYGVTINGNAYSGSNQVSVSPGGDVTVLSGTTVIPHNTDGTKTVNLSASISGKIVGSLSASETLATIPRTSSFASIPTLTLGSPGTITIKKSDSSFRHRITYWFGSAKGNCDTAQWTGTSLTWTPPLSLAEQIPNAAGGVGTLILYTYDASGRQIGTVNAACTIQLPASMVPSISSVAAAEATSGLAAKFGAYVQGKSILKVTASAAGTYGSTIRSCTISVDGKTYSGTDITTSVITGSGTLSIKASVTDSRGRTASKSITISVQPYAKPAITALSVWRCTADGAADDSGDYVGITYAYTIASVNSKNDASAKMEYKRSTATSWSSLLTNGAYAVSTTVYPAQELLSDYQWDIRLTVSDYFGSTTMTATLPSAAVILDVKADGTGIAFGGSAEFSNCVNFFWDPLFKGRSMSKPPIYYKAGKIWAARDGSDPITGIGLATIVITGRSARIDFSVRITTAGTNQMWDHGILSSLLSESGAPYITPIAAVFPCTITTADDGGINTALTGYAGGMVGEPGYGRWGFGRIYTEEGAFGGWEASAIPAGARIMGTVYGTVE